VWESLGVNLGHRLSSLFGEEFLSAPIHSPPLWSPNRSFSNNMEIGQKTLECNLGILYYINSKQY
jgi:hypothetical protein